MLKHVHDVKSVKELRRGISNYSTAYCEVKLVRTLVKRKEELNGDGNIFGRELNLLLLLKVILSFY